MTDYDGGYLSVIDTVTQTLITNIAVGPKPRGMAITPDGSQIYVTNVAVGNVSVLTTRRSLWLGPLELATVRGKCSRILLGLAAEKGLLQVSREEKLPSGFAVFLAILLSGLLRH